MVLAAALVAFVGVAMFFPKTPDKKQIAIEAQRRADEAARVASAAYQDYLASLKK